jgi:hypothetical protein
MTWLPGTTSDARWLGTLPWPERLVVIIGEIAVAYIALIVGLLVGAALHG